MSCDLVRPVGAEANAALLGAKTVKGPLALSAGARPVATTAPTSELKEAGLVWAICTTLSTPGGIRTLSIPWMMPLSAYTLAVVTLALARTASVNATPDDVFSASRAAAPSKT